MTEQNIIDGVGTTASKIKRDGPADIDWTAKWIWSSDNTSMHNWLCMRKDINLSSVPEKAEALLSIDSRYWLWINGEMVVYEGGVKRGPNKKDSYFDTVDISDYLKLGNNTFAVLGWYFGNDSDYYSYNSSGAAGFMFQADIGDIRVVSDSSWKVHKEDGYLLSTTTSDPGSQPNYRLPEENIFYDGRLSAALEGWYQPSYDVSSWNNATEYGIAGDAPWYDLWQRSIPMTAWSKEILDYQNPSAYSAYKTSATTSAVSIGMKLPTNMQMQPYLEVEAAEGLKIEMISDGTETVRTSYITKNGVQSFEGYGWMSAQTLTYKIPKGVRIIRLGYRDTGYNASIEGSFSSNDSFFNQLWTESVDTLLITMRDTYMDCPDRERAQWWGDATVESVMTFYSLDPNSYLLYRKGVDTLIGWRGQTGSGDDRVLATVVPINNGHFELPMQQLAGVIGFWTYYEYTGERDFLEQVYQPSVDYLTCWNMQSNGLVEHRPGSWDWADWGANFDVTVMENAWYYWACRSVLMIANELGVAQVPTFIIERMESIKSAYTSSLWDKNKNAYYSYTADGLADDRGNALAVLSGLATKEQYPGILNNLTTKFNSSPYMEKYVLDALYAMDAQDEALNRMKSQYARMMSDEWKTLWETFTFDGTHNHAWSGGPLVNLSGNVTGVAPDTAGYDTYHVIPQMGYLTEVNTVVPTVKGDISVKIINTDSQKTVTLTSPENTVARVAVPRFEGKNTQVREAISGKLVFSGGQALDMPAGVEYLDDDAQYIYFNVQPGSYSFEATVPSTEGQSSYTVTIESNEGGYVTLNGTKISTPFSASYAAGTSVTLAALTNNNTVLDHWSGIYGFDSETVTLTVNDNIYLKANFVEKDEDIYKLVKITGIDNCDIQIKLNGDTHSLPYTTAVREGENLSLTAVDGMMWSFNSWQGDVFSAEKTVDLTTISSDMEIKLKGAYKGSALGNMSIGAAVTVDYEYTIAPQWQASNLTDGVKLNDGGCTTTHWYSGGNYTDRPTIVDGNLPEPINLTVDMGRAKTFDTFHIYPRGSYSNGEAVNFIVDYSILASNNGTDWTKIYEKIGQENPGDGFVEISFEAQSARYVRLSVTKLGKPIYEGWDYPVYRLQLSELEVYNKNSHPLESTVYIAGTTGGSVMVNGAEQTLPYSAKYPLGTRLVLNAVNDTNYKFSGWTGDLTSAESVMNIDVSSDISLTANFKSSREKAAVSANLARGKTATSSAIDIGGSWVVSNLTDGIVQMPGGNTGGFSTGNLYSTNLSSSPVNLTVDFGSNIDFNSVKFYPRNGVYTKEGTNCHFPTSFTVYVMLDGETVWREIQSFSKVTSAPGEPLEVKFDMQNARYIRMEVTEITQPAADEQGAVTIYRVQLAEIEAYLSPLTPENLAIGGTVTSNNALISGATWNGANLTDGKLRSEGRNLTTGIKGYTTEGYASPELTNPLWVNIKMPKTETANQVILYPRSDIDAVYADSGITPNFPTKYDIQVIAEGSNEYETVASVDYGSADYNINSTPQIVSFGKNINVTDVRIVCYRLGQATWDEKTGNKYRLQLAEMQVGFVPNTSDSQNIYEGDISLTPCDATTVIKPTAFSADITLSDLSENSMVWSVENLDGSVSNVATLTGTGKGSTSAMLTPKINGEAYVVLRMSNGLKTMARTKIVVDMGVMLSFDSNDEVISVSYGDTLPDITPPVIEGNTFKGYYSGKVGTGTMYYDENGTALRTYDSEDSMTLYALWETTYTVKHYTQRLDGKASLTDTDNYELADTYTATAYVGEAITPILNSYEGFKQPIICSANIKNGGETVIRLWYGLFYGDVNLSGEITADDVVAHKRILLKSTIPTDKVYAIADVNGDTAVGLTDLLRLKLYLADSSVKIGS